MSHKNPGANQDTISTVHENFLGLNPFHPSASLQQSQAVEICREAELVLCLKINYFNMFHCGILSSISLSPSYTLQSIHKQLV